jgi:hypothetical protein
VKGLNYKRRTMPKAQTDVKISYQMQITYITRVIIFAIRTKSREAVHNTNLGSKESTSISVYIYTYKYIYVDEG